MRCHFRYLLTFNSIYIHVLDQIIQGLHNETCLTYICIRGVYTSGYMYIGIEGYFQLFFVIKQNLSLMG